MKKRLLITSIVMMLVVAVALSTATYAWFTSNATVTANSITLEAATSSADAIGIGWTTATIGTSITPNDFVRDGGLKPLVPSTVTAETDLEDITFKGGTLKNEGGADVYNDDVTDIAPYIWNGTIASTDYQDFYIKNLSTARDLTDLYVSASIDGEAAELVRIGIFMYDATDSAFELVGVLGYSYSYAAVGEAAFSGSATYYKKGAGWVAADGTTRGFVKDTAITAENFDANKANLYTRSASAGQVYYGTPAAAGARITTHSATVTSINLLSGAASVAPLGTVQLKAVVWFDGDGLDDQTQGRVAGIKLNFASNAVPSFN